MHGYNYLCDRCGKPAAAHVHTPHSLGCPPDLFVFSFEAEGTEVHRTTCSVDLARATARAIASNRRVPIRWVRIQAVEDYTEGFNLIAAFRAQEG